MNLRFWDIFRAPEQRSHFLELLRPQLPPHFSSVRRLAEPLIAAVALIVIFWLSTAGAISFGLFVLCAACVYAMLTLVFGLDLQVAGLG